MSVVSDLMSKIEAQIASVELTDTMSLKGEIIEIKDGVATVSWLGNTMFWEIVVFENWLKGMVLNLLEDQIGVLVLGAYHTLTQWQTVTGSGEIFKINVGEAFLGRVVNGIGEPIDGLWEIKWSDLYPVERIAPGVMTRHSVDQPLATGVKSIDAMIPVGKGQRELIIWDRQTGKTTIAIDTIINQKSENVKCVYVAIGQKESKVKLIMEQLRAAWALEYTTIVSAPASSPAVMQYIAPYVGVTIAEYFLYNGQDALIIYDDLSKHANAYREVSLLLRRPPGREAYPGDVFYLHSRLLERAAKLNSDYGSGSLTALPIIETQGNDVSAYIPTNVISITDGQIFLETDLFNAGIKPAINVGLSVSRVGWSAQTWLMKKVAGKLKLELSYFRELQAFAQFASDLDPATQARLTRGKIMVELLKQPNGKPLGFQKQATLIYAGINGYLDDIELSQIKQFEYMISDKLDTSYSDLNALMLKDKKLTGDIEDGIKKLISEVVSEIKASM